MRYLFVCLMLLASIQQVEAIPTAPSVQSQNSTQDKVNPPVSPTPEPPEPPIKPPPGFPIDPDNPGGPRAAGATGIAEQAGQSIEVDMEMGAQEEGLIDVDASGTMDSNASTMGLDETGSYDDTDTLPPTASNLPLIGIIGAFALASAVGLLVAMRRHR